MRAFFFDPRNRLKSAFFGFFVLFCLTSCRSNRQWAEIFLKKGNEYQARGEYALALVEYQKAQRIDREFVAAHLAAADAYIQIGRCDVAIEEINFSSVLDPQIPGQYFFKKAECLLKRNPPDLWPAVTEGLQFAIKNDPRNPEYYKMTGDIYERLGKKELAAQFHQKAQELSK